MAEKIEVQQSNFRMYLLVVVISSVISAAGSVLAENWKEIFGSDNAEPIKATNLQPPKLDPGPIEDRPPRHSVLPTWSAKFGKWSKREANVTYKAESDGFVSAFTSGNRLPNEVLVHVGEKIEKLPLRTRTGRYDGTVCPVSKGDYWIVRTRPNQEGGTAVQWLPVTRSVMASE